MAVMAAIIGFSHLLAGFDNAALVQLAGTSLDRPYTSRQATYDLRRLKRKGLIVRLAGSHRYQLTPLGRRVAVLFTKAYGRVPCPRARRPRPPATARTSPTNPTRHRLAPTRPHPGAVHQRRTHRHPNAKLGLNVKLGLTVNFPASKRS
jgi:hypothetical protein